MKEAKPMHAYILLDRTGSMVDRWEETLSALNTYAAGLADPSDGEAVDARITLALFDHMEGLKFDVIRRDQPAAQWTQLTPAEAVPRGWTPLFDAIGRIVAVAETDAPAEAVIVVITDGLENTSREMTREGAKAALDRARSRGWQIVFLGADFAQFSDAEALGVQAASSMAMASGSYDEAMNRMSRKSRAFFAKKDAMTFDESDRAAAGEAKVKRKET